MLSVIHVRSMFRVVYLPSVVLPHTRYYHDTPETAVTVLSAVYYI
jgi:hypothetical protein